MGFDLVEVCPPYDAARKPDDGDIISILAANLVFEFFALLALKKPMRYNRSGKEIALRKWPLLVASRTNSTLIIKVMSKQNVTSSKTWIIVHVYFPLFPAVLEVIIRLGVIHFDWTWGTFWDIFSGPTLAMSCGLVCLFIYQSLISISSPLSNRTKEEDRKQWAMIFIMGAIVFFAFFGVIMQVELFATYHNNPAAKANMSFYKGILFILAVITVRVSHRIPHHFNLEATL